MDDVFNNFYYVGADLHPILGFEIFGVKRLSTKDIHYVSKSNGDNGLYLNIYDVIYNQSAF